MMLHIFSYVCHPYFIFGKLFLHIWCPFLVGLFVFLMLNFESSLGIGLWSHMWFPNIFFYSVVCLVSFNRIFEDQWFSVLMKSNLFLNYLSCYMVSCLRTLHQALHVEDFLLYYFTSFIVCFMFKSLIHLFQHHVKKTVFPLLNFFTFVTDLSVILAWAYS